MRTAEQIATEMRAVMSPIGREQYVYAYGTIRAIVDATAGYASDAERITEIRVAIEAVALVNAGRSQEFGPDVSYADREDGEPLPDLTDTTPHPRRPVVNQMLEVEL